MSESLTIAEGLVVGVHYELKNDAGENLDRSGEEPMFYLHGCHNIVPGLEKALVGKSVGDELEVSVAPEEGYGPTKGMKPQKLMRSAFPQDADISVGSQFVTQTPEGQPFPIWVTKIVGRDVYISAEHPLAGVTLHFSVKIDSVRQATEGEMAQGQPHGPDGGEKAPADKPQCGCC